MSEGLHHFKFFYQRFLTSTVGWKEEEQGAYLRLLIVQFDQGGIPPDTESIGAISPVARKIWDKKLKNKFQHVNNDGTLFNKVMAGIRNEAIEKRTVNRENGGMGGRPKKNRTVISGKPNGFQMETQTESETKPIPLTNNQEEKNIKKEADGWTFYPGPDCGIELTETEVGGVAEYIALTKRITLPSARIVQFWKAFVLDLTGKEFYQYRVDLTSHFRNWLRRRDLSSETVAAPGTAATYPQSAPLKRIG